MRRTIRFAVALFVLLAATTAVAMAEPVNPTDPYPRVADPGGDTCVAEAGAVDRLMIEYGIARRPYDRAKQALAAGVGAQEQVAAAEKPLLELVAKLNTAKYALAACRSKEGPGEAKDKKCAALYLEYNKQLDALAILVELEKLTQAELRRVQNAGNLGVEGRQVLDAAELAARLAEHDRKLAQRLAEVALRKIRADADCKDGSFQRPQQAPPPREVVVPTSAEPPTELTSAPPPTTSAQQLEASARVSVTAVP